MTTTPQFLSKNYNERQLIVVVDDEVYRSVRAIELKGEEPPEDSGLANRLLDIATWVFVPQLVLAKQFYRLYLEYKKTLKQQGISTLMVPRSEAAHLQLPVGHPVNDTVYAGHPLVPTIYYPLGHFHRFTFEHKFAELTRLLMSLGAKEIEVERQEGWGKEVFGDLDIPLPSGAGGVQFEAGKASRSNSNLLFRATLSGDGSPRLPDDLAWYHHEPLWRQVAEGRLRYGLRTFSVVLRYEDDFGVNGSLGAKVATTSLNLGGKFQERQRTVWRASGSFE